VWTPTPHGDAMFYARRFTHETAVHRADAELALGLPFRLAPEMAADGIEEWLESGSLPFHFDIHPWMRELLAPDRTIGLRADCRRRVIDWHRGEVDSPVLVSGSLTELLLVIYKRRPPGTDGRRGPRAAGFLVGARRLRVRVIPSFDFIHNPESRA
jgi:hypothetical protein